MISWRRRVFLTRTNSPGPKALELTIPTFNGVLKSTGTTLWSWFTRDRDAYRSETTTGGVLSEISQFVIVCEHEHGLRLCEELRADLPRCHVVRTTSPLDGQSMWIEIFPLGVSKASGCALIAERYGLTPEEVMGIGNDFNDLDMLDWVGSAFVVANSPPEMRAKYRVVSSHEESGLSESVALWRGETRSDRR